MTYDKVNLLGLFIITIYQNIYIYSRLVKKFPENFLIVKIFLFKIAGKKNSLNISNATFNKF